MLPCSTRERNTTNTPPKTLETFLSSFLLSRTINMLHLSIMVLPNNLYWVPHQTPLINTIDPQTFVHMSFLNIVYTPGSLILLIYIKFLARFGMWNIVERVLILPSFSSTLVFHTLWFWKSSHLLGRYALHFTFHIYKTTPCGESYEKKHMIQSTNYHFLNVYLYKPNTHALLLLRRTFFLWMEYPLTPSLFLHFLI